MKPPHELLYDSEASLRLVDRAIGDLSPARTERDSQPVRQLRLEQSTDDEVEQDPAWFDAHSETAAIVVRFCQSAGMLDSRGVDTLAHMPSRLRDVSAQTEIATTDILDGLGRAVKLIDDLDGAECATEEGRRATATKLRDELNVVSHHLQFQDITSQQLADIAALFADMRSRIAQVVSIFAPPHAAASQPASAVSGSPSAAEGQAIADEIFALKVAIKV